MKTKKMIKIILIATAVLSFCSTTYATQGPIAHWRLDDGIGVTAIDSVGTNDGTLVNDPNWVAGKIGTGALEFDGVDDYVNLGNDSSLKPTLPITISAWVKLNLLGKNHWIMNNDNRSARYYGVWFYVTDYNKIGVGYGDGGLKDSGHRRSKGGTTELNVDTWYHIALVVKGPTDMNIYINGADDGGSYSGTGGGLTYSVEGDSYIGSDSGVISFNNGTIDDVRIYDRALDAEEIAALYAEAFTTYHVDGSTGSDINDGLTRETAFETIQFAIDTAEDGKTVLVWPGVYDEAGTWGIDFWGKAITVTAAAEPPILEVTNYAYAVTFSGNEDSNSVFSNFVVRNCDTAFLARYSSPTITNVTVVDNDEGLMADNANPNITNCIFWNNTNGDLLGIPDPITAQYSFIEEEIDDLGLVAHWKLDGDATDSAGSNDGTIYGATTTTGQINDALDFDGVDDYVDCGNDSSLKPALPVTISAWIKLNSTGINQFITIIDHKINNHYGFSLYVADDNKLRVGYGDGGPADKWHRRSKAGTTELLSDIWYHVTAIINGPTDMKFYINGVEDGGTYSGSGGSLAYSTGNFTIGSKDLSNFFFSGIIDDVRIYDSALSAGQIEAIYETGAAGLCYGEPGFADPNSGDYHLLSERGRYRATTDEWILDNVTSPCIDSGDPTVNPSAEPMPNGGRVNMGAYGNTASASMSEWEIEADLDYDGSVGAGDMGIFSGDWLEQLMFVDDPAGSALDFDGTDDYVDCGDNPSLDVTNEITISARVKIKEAALNKWLVAKGEWGGNLNGDYWLNLHPSTNELNFAIHTSTIAYRSPGFSYATDKWYCVVGVFDGSSLALYIDGQSVGSPTLVGDSVGTNTHIVTIGGASSSQANVDGTIDEVAIYDRALSASEIEDIYHCGVVADANMVGYWDFEEGAGQVAADKSGNGNDGQLGSTGVADSSDPVWVDSEVPGVTWYVDGSSGDNSNDGLSRETAFATIQKGINTAEDCDTVVVAAGVYYESVYVMDKQITIKSADEPAVIDGGYDDAVGLYTWADKQATLKNFILQNGYAGVYVDSGSPVLKNLTIVDCYTGIEAEDGAEPNIISCILAGNDYDLWNCTAENSFVEEDFNDGLVAHWKLDGDATDSAGTNDGTINGAITTTGQINDALDFDGSNDYVDLGNDNSLKNGLPVTFCAWIKLESLGTVDAIVVTDDIGSVYRGVGLANHANNKMQVYYGDGTGRGASDIRVKVGTTEFSAGVWYYVATVVRGPTDMELYVNGVDDGGTYSGTGGNVIHSSSSAYIGSNGHPNDWFHGTIDEVRIYDTALSAGQIEAMYAAGLAGHEYGPLFADASSGDYRLLSERGRYRVSTDEWILDDVTSPCVDGGDPYAALGDESMPNGGRVNMGAYGGTTQASMSEWLLVGDLNLDGIVNLSDYAVFALSWLEKEEWKN